MKKNLLTMGLCAALFATTLQVNAEPTMVANYKVGDSMGATGITLKVVNLYDAQNKVVRTYEIATDYNGDSYTETIITYTYNEQGLLEREYNVQYQPAYGKWEPKDEFVYQYDEQGRLKQVDSANRGNAYTYNEQGYLTNEKYYSNTTETTIQDISYFDFDTNGNPARSESDGYQSDYRFDGTYTYDALGRCIDIMRHCVAGTVHSRDTYEYDEAGILTHNYKYMSAYGAGGREGGQVGGTKDTLRYDQHIERVNLGNGWYQKTVWTWTYYISQWTKGSTVFNELYVNLDGAFAPRNAVAENVSTPERPNTVKVTADVPATLPVANTSYIIWRNGMMIATVEATDGKIEYFDENVENASYEYFVQAYDAVNDVYYNASDVAAVDVKMPLSYAENIRVVGGYHGTYNDPDAGAYESFFIKLAWDVKPCDDAVLGYKVWVYPWAYPLVEIKGDVKECELSMVDDEAANIRVDVVYEHGVQEGEYVTLFWDNSADFEGEPSVKYYISYEKNYGDHMGTPGASSINYYIYDNNNNLSRRIDYGYQTDGSAVPTYHYFYEYNQNGQIISEFYRQMNSLGEWGKNKMTYVYTYDNFGRLVSKEDTTSHRLYEYFYDMTGRLTSMTDKTRTYGSNEYDKLNSTTNYVTYDEKGNPTYVEYVHHAYASSCYNTTYTYDDQNRVLVQEARTPEGLAYEKFEYTYDKYGVITLQVRSMPWYDETTYQPTERFVPSTRTVREAQGGMVYKAYDENYDIKGDKWNNTSKRYTMETYSPLNGALTPQNLVVTDASTPESPNTIEIECNYPKIKLANAQYIIWRGCTPVDTVDAPATQGIIRFRDVNVGNGTYEYIVQTYDVASNQPFNATAPVVFTLEAQLDPVSNLHFVAQTEGIYRDRELNSDLPVYWIKFAWDAPQTSLPILHYNVYQDGYKIPVSQPTNTTDSVWVYRQAPEDIANQTTSTLVEVTVSYSLGESVAAGETFEVEIAATDKVSFEGSAYVAAKTLFTEPNAAVVLYNAAGSVVATYSNKQQYDLSALASGVYVAVVKVGNDVQIVKVAL